MTNPIRRIESVHSLCGLLCLFASFVNPIRRIESLIMQALRAMERSSRKEFNMKN